MKSLIVGLALLACATSAEAAEVWTCTYTDGSNPVLVRFEVSPPDLIDASTQEHYRILQNNGYGLVATLSISGIQEWQKDPAVGAVSIVINKGTGEFWWNNTFAGAARVPNGSAHGKCLN